jgi:hypothetical protein
VKALRTALVAAVSAFLGVLADELYSHGAQDAMDHVVRGGLVALVIGVCAFFVRNLFSRRAPVRASKNA